MMSISPIPSLEYLLKQSLAGNTDALDLLAKELDSVKNNPEEAIPYYAAPASTDPLAQPGAWFGKLAEKLGMQNGGNVQARDYALLYFGFDPSGKGKLREDIPDIKEQIAAKKAVEAANISLGRAILSLQKVRKEKGKDSQEAKAAKAKVEEAEKAKKAAETNSNNRRSGTDIVFSAPKEPSMYLLRLKADAAEFTKKAKAELAPEKAEALKAKATENFVKARAVEDAFRQATVSTMKAIEEEFIKRRVGGGDTRFAENVQGIAAAIFTHYEARAVQDENGAITQDCQLHEHVSTMNLALGWDDEIHAAWTDMLKNPDTQKMLGAMHRALFAQGLKDLGIMVVSDEQEKIHSFKIAGVSDEQAKEFSKRDKQVNSNKSAGMNAAQAKLFNRGAKDLSGEQFLSHLLDRMDKVGFTADQVEAIKTEQDLIALMRKQVEQTMRIEHQNGLIKHAPGTDGWSDALEKRMEPVIEELEKSRKAWDKQELIEQLIELEPSFKTEHLERLIFERLQTADIERRVINGVKETGAEAALRAAKEQTREILADQDICVVNGIDHRSNEPRFTSRKQREKEIEFYANVLPKMMNAQGFGVAADIANSVIEAENAKNKENGWQYSIKQEEGIRRLATSESQLFVLTAWAGSGKSTGANCAVKIWEKAGKTVLALAPSNSAAQGLAKEIGTNQYYRPEKLALEISNGKIQLTKDHVLFIDEASMLDFKETKTLLDEAIKGGAKVIMQGDPAQLPSVGLGNVLRRIVDTPEFKDNIYSITSTFEDAANIQRQKAFWQKQATAMLSIGNVNRAIEEYDRRGFLSQYDDGSEMLQAACNDYLKDLLAPAARLAAARAAFEPKKDMEPIYARKERAQLKEASDAMVAAFKENVLLATTNENVGKLNQSVRDALKAAGALGQQTINIDRQGDKLPLQIAIGERLYFEEKVKAARTNSGKKEAVMKGKIGTVLGFKAANDGTLRIQLAIDNEKVKKGGKEIQKVVEIDPRLYEDFAYAYALTTHRAQGISINNAVFVATSDDEYRKGVAASFMSAETALVGMTRHKQSLKIHCLATHYQTFVKNASAITNKIEANDLLRSYLDAAPEEAHEQINNQIKKGEEAAAQLSAPQNNNNKETQNEPRATAAGTANRATRQSSNPFASGQKAPWTDPQDLHGLRHLSECHLDNGPERNAQMLLPKDVSPNLQPGEGSGGRAPLLGKSAAAGTTRGIRFIDAILNKLRRTTPRVANKELTDQFSKLIGGAMAGDPRQKQMEGILKLGIAGGPTAIPGCAEVATRNFQWVAASKDYLFGINDATGQIEAFKATAFNKHFREAAITMSRSFAGNLDNVLLAQTTSISQRQSYGRAELVGYGIEETVSKETNKAVSKRFVEIINANGNRQKIYRNDLYDKVIDAKIQKGEEFEFAMVGKTTTKVPAVSIVNGIKQFSWEGAKTHTKELFEVARPQLAPHEISRLERKEVLELIKATAFKDKSMLDAIGLSEKRAAQAFASENQIIGLRQIDKGISSADASLEAFKNGSYDEKTKTYTLGLVVLAVQNGKAYCATPFEGSMLSGQTNDSTQIYAIDASENKLIAGAKQGQSFLVKATDSGTLSFETAERKPAIDALAVDMSKWAKGQLHTFAASEKLDAACMLSGIVADTRKGVTYISTGKGEIVRTALDLPSHLKGYRVDIRLEGYDPKGPNANKPWVAQETEQTRKLKNTIEAARQAEQSAGAKPEKALASLENPFAAIVGCQVIGCHNGNVFLNATRTNEIIKAPLSSVIPGCNDKQKEAEINAFISTSKEPVKIKATVGSQGITNLMNFDTKKALTAKDSIAAALQTSSMQMRR